MLKKIFACSIQLLKKYIKIFKSQSTHPFSFDQEKKPFIMAHANSNTETPNKFKLPNILISNVEYFKICYKILAFDFFVMNFA